MTELGGDKRKKPIHIKRWLTEAVLLAAAPVLVYYTGYCYEFAAAKELGIPEAFVQLSTSSMINSLELVGVLFAVQCAVIFSAQLAFMNSAGWKAYIPGVVRFYVMIAPVAMLREYSLIHLLVLLPATLVGLLILFAIAALCFQAATGRKIRSPSGWKGSPLPGLAVRTLNLDFQGTEFTNRIRTTWATYLFIQLAIAAPPLAELLGKASAIAGSDGFYAKAKMGRVHVVRRYGDYAFAHGPVSEKPKNDEDTIKSEGPRPRLS